MKTCTPTLALVTLAIALGVGYGIIAGGFLLGKYIFGY
jgi:hypothetical protein